MENHTDKDFASGVLEVLERVKPVEAPPAFEADVMAAWKARRKAPASGYAWLAVAAGLLLLAALNAGALLRFRKGQGNVPAQDEYSVLFQDFNPYR